MLVNIVIYLKINVLYNYKYIQQMYQREISYFCTKNIYYIYIYHMNPITIHNITL